MLRRAIDKGVSKERLARAFNVNLSTINSRINLLHGICPKAVELLQDHQFTPDVTRHLRKMKAAGTKASLRVALNVALYDSKEVKVLEQGVMFFKDLVRVREKYGLEKWAFEIQRHGAAKDPKTTYSILPEHQLSVEQQKAFQALPQHDLAKLYSSEGDSGGAKGGQSLDSYDKKSDAKGDGTVPPSVAQGLVTALKALPREATDKFLAKFGVQRIKDLPTSQVEKARAFVEQLQTESAAPAADETEVDPFA